MPGGWRKCRTSTPPWSPSIRKTARCWRWLVVLTSTRASLTVQPRRYARGIQHQAIPVYRQMDKGLTLASMLNDVPISRWDAGAGSDWQLKNSRRSTPVLSAGRQGLGQSKNVVMRRHARYGRGITRQSICNVSVSRHRTLCIPNHWRWVRLRSRCCRWRAVIAGCPMAASWSIRISSVR